MANQSIKAQQNKEEGLGMVIGEAEGLVIIDFGKPTHWLGLEPQDMIDFAKKLTDVAEALIAKKEQLTS